MKLLEDETDDEDDGSDDKAVDDVAVDDESVDDEGASDDVFSSFSRLLIFSWRRSISSCCFRTNEDMEYGPC